MSILTPNEVQRYRDQGYIALPNVLCPDELEELRRVTDEFINKSKAVTQNTTVFDLEPGHSPDAPRLRRLKFPVKQHDVYARALRHDTILGIVSQLIGKNIRYNGDKLNLKSAEYGSPVAWHQDWAFYPHTNDDLLAVGVAIDPMTLDNGCLMVIPGSHRGPVFDHHRHGQFVGAITDPAFSASDAISVTVPAGGVTIHHVRLVHGSQPNTSTQSRRLLLFQYCAVDAWPLEGIPNWDEFNSMILEGEPTTIPRMIAVPVRVPYPYPETDSIYEMQEAVRNSA